MTLPRMISTARYGPVLVTMAALLAANSTGFAQDKEKEKPRAGAKKLPGKGQTREGKGNQGGGAPAARENGRGAAVPGRGPAAAGRGNVEAPRGNVSPAGGRNFGGHAAPPGGAVRQTAHGSASFDRRGNPREVHVRDMEIHHGPGGSRVIMRERPGGVRIVSNARGFGYVQHPYAFRGTPFVQRTYFVGGVAYTRMYRPFVLGGVAINVYTPGLYYRPAFYGWAYNPWAVPVVYGGWGWAGSPWFAYYGGWFTPYPRYIGPAWWLTDYLVSQSLMAAYQQQQAAAAAAAYNAPLSQDVKDQIALEVQRQIALENSEASAGMQPPDPGSSGIARMLTDGQPHVFVAASGLDVASNTVGECFVTEGDVLRLNGPVPPGQPANLTVLASKGQDCPRGSMVQVQVADLQEMQNHMRETIDQGMADLQKKQGQGGLPAAPAAAAAPPQRPEYAAIAPPPDPNVQTELQQQTTEATQAEQQVLQEAAASGPNDAAAGPPPDAAAPPAPTRKVVMGMSIEDVTAAWGKPKDVVDLGARQIYVYDGIKFTFTNGKLTSAE